jgi:hypothetical protein
METHTFYGLGYAFEVNAIKTVCGLRRTPSIFLSGIFLGVIMKHPPPILSCPQSRLHWFRYSVK